MMMLGQINLIVTKHNHSYAAERLELFWASRAISARKVIKE